MAAVLLLVVAIQEPFRSPSVDPSQATEAIELAKQAAAQGQYQLGLEVLDGIDSPEAQLIVAGLHRQLGDLPAALSCFESLFDDSDFGCVALSEAARIRLESGDLSISLKLFRRAADTGESGPLVNSHIALIEAVAGRTWRAKPELDALLDQTAVGQQELVLLATPSSPSLLPAELRESESQDPLYRLAHAQTDAAEGRIDEALATIETLLSNPDPPLDTAVIAATLLQNRPTLMANALERVPESARDHPDFWTLRGRVALANQLPSESVRCALEAQRLLPDHRTSLQLLREAALASGDNELAEVAARRGRPVQIVSSIRTLLDSAGADRRTLKPFIEALIELGRRREAEKWLLLLESTSPQADWTTALRSTLAASTNQPSPILGIDRAQFPLPTSKIKWPRPTSLTADGANEADLRFGDDAQRVGIELTPWVRADVAETGRLMHEFTGTGVAALDYDNDGYDDLALGAVSKSPTGTLIETAPGQLYRNHHGQSFSCATTNAGFEIRGCNQGVAAGDIDGDGFADAYIANVGRNRLLLNNGDGTFRIAEIKSPDSWTTSVAIADVTGDAVADLFDVNYVQGDDVFEKVCDSGDDSGPPRACSPLSFQPTFDCLHQGLGNGDFETLGVEEHANTEAGNGLGLLIGQLANRPDSTTTTIHVFVANDLSPNHFLSFDTSNSRFVDTGLLVGVAFNRDGAVEAGMGVAWGDATGDGSGDLLVTNFTRESNTLYVSDGELFADETSERRLSEPSISPLGFGAQFLDADLDGDPDLFIANGHIDDFRHTGVPFAMKPLVHRNEGGAFTVVEASTGYANQEHVGRAVARVDWNQDFRDDLIVTHLTKSPALLTNSTKPKGRAGSVKLVGTRSHRDAVGAIIRTKHPDTDRPQTVQVTAGDGYMASNSKSLVIATGSQPFLPITIHWPSGVAQEATVMADQRTVVVEQ